MKVMYQITVEIDDEEVDRTAMHEEVIQFMFDSHWRFARMGTFKVLHSVKVSERDK